MLHCHCLSISLVLVLRIGRSRAKGSRATMGLKGHKQVYLQPREARTPVVARACTWCIQNDPHILHCWSQTPAMEMWHAMTQGCSTQEGGCNWVYKCRTRQVIVLIIPLQDAIHVECVGRSLVDQRWKVLKAWNWWRLSGFQTYSVRYGTLLIPASNAHKAATSAYDLTRLGIYSSLFMAELGPKMVDLEANPSLLAYLCTEMLMHLLVSLLLSSRICLFQWDTEEG